MADPISLSLIAVGTAMSGISAISSGYSQASNYQAQANAQNYNAAVQKQQAQLAMAQSVEQSNVQHRKAAQQLGEQRAATAQSNIGFGGTGGDLLEQSANYAELDRQNILYNGLLTGMGLNAQAEQSTYAANVASSQIGSSITGGYMSGAGSLIGGVGNYMGTSRSIDRQQRLDKIMGVM